MEIPLAGGYLSSPVRVGDTVRRARTGTSERTSQTLELLRRLGFTAAPRWLGRDSRDRDILTYIDGESRLGSVRDRAVLRPVFELIKQLHDLTTRADGTVLCHNDLSPRNTIFRDDRPVGFIDWDDAAYDNAIKDVAHAAWQFLGAGPGCEVEELRSDLRYICDCYGSLSVDSAFVDAMILEVKRVHDNIEEMAVAGDVRYLHLVEIGALNDLTAVSTWLSAAHHDLVRA